jgi:hypothetical protein
VISAILREELKKFINSCNRWMSIAKPVLTSAKLCELYSVIQIVNVEFRSGIRVHLDALYQAVTISILI